MFKMTGLAAALQELVRSDLSDQGRLWWRGPSFEERIIFVEEGQGKKWCEQRQAHGVL